MGRRKLPIQFIQSDKARRETFKKRVKGLKGKASQLATLCNARVGVVIICDDKVEEAGYGDEFKNIIKELCVKSFAAHQTKALERMLEPNFNNGLLLYANGFGSTNSDSIVAGNSKTTNSLGEIEDESTPKSNMIPNTPDFDYLRDHHEVSQKFGKVDPRCVIYDQHDSSQLEYDPQPRYAVVHQDGAMVHIGNHLGNLIGNHSGNDMWSIEHVQHDNMENFTDLPYLLFDPKFDHPHSA